MNPAAPISILSALAEEQRGLIEQLRHPKKITHANRDFWLGECHGHPAVLALSKIGKVAAATTATTLIEHFGANRIVFTGVAGGLAEGIHVGDVVVGQSFMQHDMDASPLFARYEVPLHGKTIFECDAELTAALLKASQHALALPHLRVAYPAASVQLGLIASGDRFVSSAAESQGLRTALLLAGHDVLAVEMEGAAVAQVATITACRLRQCAPSRTGQTTTRMLIFRVSSTRLPANTRWQLWSGCLDCYKYNSCLRPYLLP